MNGRVIEIDPLADARWERFVQCHPQARLTHSSAWIDILQRTYGYRPAHLAYEVEGAVHGVLPLLLISSGLTGRRLVSLPFSGPAGPIGTCKEGVDALVAAAVRLANELRCDYLKLLSRDDLPQLGDQRLSATRPFVCSVLPLQPRAEVVWRDALSSTVRQDIRRGRRRGLVTRISSDREDLKVFYGLFIETSRKHGIPPQPFRLFENTWELLAERGMAWLFLAMLENRVVNAMLCFGFKDIFSAGYVGTDYRHLRRYHSVKVTDWAAIEMACQLGFNQFDFLQSHVKNAGLRWYKGSFGSTELPMTYYYFPATGRADGLREMLVGGRSSISKAARAVVRRMPSAGLEVIGGAIFKHVG